MNSNRETYSSLGNLSIDKKTMEIIQRFPHNIYNKFVNRHFLFNSLIKNKIIIYQLFVKKDICDLELGHLKSDKKMMKQLNTVKNLIKKQYLKLENNKEEEIDIKPLKIRKSKRVYYLHFKKID